MHACLYQPVTLNSVRVHRFTCGICGRDATKLLRLAAMEPYAIQQCHELFIQLDAFYRGLIDGGLLEYRG